MKASPVKTWQRTSIQNLVRHKSGRYYARIFANGKETWKALKTDLLEVAKIKLREIAGDIEKAAFAEQAQERGKMTMEDCSIIFMNQINAGFGLRGRGKTLRRIGQGTIHYRQQTLRALWRSWPELKAMNVRKVASRDLESWSQRFAKDYSPTRYNNTLDTLRALFRIAVEAGARIDNPADRIGRVQVLPKPLILPGREEFKTFVKAMREAGGWCSNDCADFVQFMAYTGARKNEAAHVTWADVDFSHNRIHLRITKGSKPRHVDMSDAAAFLLRRIREEREEEPINTPVLRVHEAQKAMDSAAKKAGIRRITHHDLRHLFATACIESGIDIPTISRWLGHSDGGALAMRTYGHLRDDHAAAQAKKISFEPLSASPESTMAKPVRRQRLMRMRGFHAERLVSRASAALREPAEQAAAAAGNVA